MSCWVKFPSLSSLRQTSESLSPTEDGVKSNLLYSETIHPGYIPSIPLSHFRLDVHSGCLAGPVLVAPQSYKMRLFVGALADMSRDGGSFPVGKGYSEGWESRFSWVLGTRRERDISASFAFGVNADYLQKRFQDERNLIAPQERHSS